jgi:enamine deaminase RidA (YjgF/YER057c/UK114 family)
MSWQSGVLPMKTYSTMLMLALLVSEGAAQADGVRHPIPNSSFPISQSVEVSGNVTTYYVSGQVPPVADKTADATSPQAYGDTKTQTIGVLNKIKGILEGLGLGLGDVVKMQVSQRCLWGTLARNHCKAQQSAEPACRGDEANRHDQMAGTGDPPLPGSVDAGGFASSGR